VGSTISGVHVSEVRWGIISRPRAAWRSVPSAPRPFYMRETEASPRTTSSSSHRTTSSAVLPHPLGFSAMSTRGGGGGRRGGRGQQGGGRGGGSGRGGGRGRGQGAVDLGGFREDTRGGPGRGHRGGSASSGAAQRGGGHAAQSQSPHPAAGPGPGPGRGGYSSAPRQVSSGPTPAEVEAMRRQVERKVVVDETQAQRCQGSSSSQAPAPRPAMQDKAPGPLAPAGRPLSIPAQSPAFFQAPAVRPAMQAKPPGQVAQAASSSSSFPMLATVQAPTPGQPATALHGKPPGQVAQAASSSSSSFPMLATAQAPRPGRPATALQGKPPGQVTQAASSSSSFPMLATVQAPTPGRPATALHGKPPGQVVPAAIPSSFPAPAPVQGSTPGRPAMQAKPPGHVAPAASSSERPLQMQGKVPDQMALSAPAGTLPPASSKAMVFPPRPGYGTVGRRCQVRANHVEVKLGDKDIYHYDVRTHGPPICVLVCYSWLQRLANSNPTKPYMFQERNHKYHHNLHP
jgi:hypothetical protein